eukprot:gene5464-5465_t
MGPSAALLQPQATNPASPESPIFLKPLENPAATNTPPLITGDNMRSTNVPTASELGGPAAAPRSPTPDPLIFRVFATNVAHATVQSLGEQAFVDAVKSDLGFGSRALLDAIRVAAVEDLGGSVVLITLQLTPPTGDLEAFRASIDRVDLAFGRCLPLANTTAALGDLLRSTPVLVAFTPGTCGFDVPTRVPLPTPTTDLDTEIAVPPPSSGPPSPGADDEGARWYVVQEWGVTQLVASGGGRGPARGAKASAGQRKGGVKFGEFSYKSPSSDGSGDVRTKDAPGERGEQSS